jgi:uncharacterized membrane protein
MNNDLMRWLLDLDVIPAGSQGLRLAWERAWPAWAWFLILLAAALFALWSYSRMLGRRSGRTILALTRMALIVLLLLVISGPMIELPRETIEQDWVLILADRSESMKIADVEAPPGSRTSRDGQLRGVLEGHAATWSRLEKERHVVWLGFHVGAFPLPAPAAAAQGAPPVVDLGEPAGRRTNLNSAIEQALQRAAGRPLSGVVVLSDGRTADPPGRALLRRLQAESVPVFVIPLGSDDPAGDVAIRRVDAPRRAFIRDKVPVVIELDELGGAGDEGIEGTIRLVDEVTGESLDTADLAAARASGQVTLTAEPGLAGQATWKVVLDTTRPDLIPENNARSVLIELVDRPLRVLYVEGYPRWEYRYVKNLIVREESIDSSVMLISADRDFAQEGNQPISRLPRSPEEFAQFDVIVLGDLPGSFFSPEQLDMIRNQVAERGGGLLWIGGERYTPATFADTPLADLLPMRAPLLLSPVGEPVNMVPTPLAARLGVLRLFSRGEAGWPQEVADPSYGWSQLHWAQRIEPGRLKPAAEVLATTNPAYGAEALPLVVQMRYGAGQTIYVATDEIWRWRYGRGELLPEQFWVQILRLLGRESLAGGGDVATLEASPRRLAVGQPIRIDLRVLDAALARQQRASVTAAIQTDDGRPITEIELRRADAQREEYAATYLPDVTGTLRVRISDPTLPSPPGASLEASVEVFAPDDEMRRPETDHALLATLAQQTGGRVLGPGDVDRLPDPGFLPNRSVRTLNPLTERIWDTPLAFALLLSLVTFEWIGRKLLRLA